MGGFLALALLPEMLLSAGKGRQHIHLAPGYLLQRVHVPLRVEVQQHVAHRPALGEKGFLGFQPLQGLQQDSMAFIQPGQGGVAPLQD